MSGHAWVRGRVSALLVGLGVVAALTIGPLPGASVAHAAGGDILVSQDGVTWSTTLSGDIFDTSDMLVPGDSLHGAFYVKNDNPFPAYLRIGLSALSVTDWSLAQALSLTTIGTGSSGASGSAAAFSGPGVVCSDLLQRDDPVPPGGVVLVSADLLFRASTSGTTAQGEIAQIAFIVELSDIDLNTFGQPLCTNTLRIGPPDPTGPGTGGSTGPGSEGATGPGAGGATPPGGGSGGASGPGGTSDSLGGVDGSVVPGEGDGGADASGSAIDRPAAAGTIEVDGAIGLEPYFYNTVRWWEEYAILVPLGAALLGMIGRVYWARRQTETAPRRQVQPDGMLGVEQG